MVRKKYHTLFIMPSSPGKRVIKFSLPSFCWRILCVMAAAILLWAGVGTWSVYHHKQITQWYLFLVKENQLAKNLLVDQKQKVEYLNQQLTKIREQAIFVRKFLGLEPQGIAKGNIGQGGEEVSPQAFSFPPELPSRVNPERPNLTNSARPPCLSRHEISKIYTDLDQIIKTLQNKQQEMEHTPSISPVDPQKSWISSGYGIRISPFTGKKRLHLGIDIAGWKGTPIVATANGKVIFVGKSRTLGLMARIRHDSTFTTEYAHLLKAAVKKGQYVKRGEMIGYMGNSGWSMGYHVHYGIKKYGRYINPFPHMLDWDRNFLLAAGKREAWKN
jgi:murein DD-endopeptidase MepM/ murein hydrolase activator NlpD